MNSSLRLLLRRRVAGAALCCVALVASLSFAAVPAHAATSVFTPSEEAAVRAQMDDVGIDTSTQDSLLAKLNSGVFPDSSQPDAVPVQSTMEQTKIFWTTTNIFADGSRTVVIQDAVTSTADTLPVVGPKKVSPRATPTKTQCSYSSGWYNDCKIQIKDWVSKASFIIDYQTSSSGAAKVRDMRALICGNSVGGCSISGKIRRATQSSSGPAWAEASFHADIAHIGSGVSGAFGLRVSGKTAKTYPSS